MKMGLPAVITIDQGSEFKNQLNDEMMKILNIRHHLITAYHPQVDKIKRVGGSSRCNVQKLLCIGIVTVSATMALS